MEIFLFQNLYQKISATFNKATGIKKLLVKNTLNLGKKKLILLKQTHSSKVIRVSNFNLNQNLEADGVITSLKNVVLGILTADCAPILLYDKKKKLRINHILNVYICLWI